MIRIVALVLVLLPPTVSSAAELAPTLKAGEHDLVLNGSGVRKKYYLGMYAAGLYLTEPNRQPTSIIEADAPMAIRIVVTSNLVTEEKLVESLYKGFKRSTRGKVEPIRSEIQSFRRCFTDGITSGDVFDLVYTPGTGVTAFKNGKDRGTTAGLAFKQALFGIWLCERPADSNLKVALLGRARK